MEEKIRNEREELLKKNSFEIAQIEERYQKKINEIRQNYEEVLLQKDYFYNNLVSEKESTIKDIETRYIQLQSSFDQKVVEIVTLKEEELLKEIEKLNEAKEYYKREIDILNAKLLETEKNIFLILKV